MIQSDSMSLSIEDRPIPIIRRFDLEIKSSEFQGDTCWVIKDPVGMKYFRLLPPEFVVFNSLDGHKSFAEILLRLEREFPEQRFRIDAIQNLVATFHKSGLLLSPASGQTRPLVLRRWNEFKSKALSTIMNIYAIRFPGFDPEPILQFFYPVARWFFTWTALTLNLIVGISALILIGANWTEFNQKLPDFHSFFGLNNAFQLSLILMFTKTVHEFGHAFCCRRMGGECHEIGFMILVMTPAMYCNTSDSWINTNKWQRMAIAAAGMYVELFLASIATWIWWFTNPGWVHFTALNVMFMSSVSTVVFNINPLMRYDGYFILSDLLEIPNLAQKSKLALQDRLQVLCLGMKPTHSKQLPAKHRGWFALYAIASFVYRWSVTLGIFWFLTKVFEPWGIEKVGQALVGAIVIAMFSTGIYKSARFFSFPGRKREIKHYRLGLSVVLLVLGIAGIMLVPIPMFVSGHFVVEPLAGQKVYLKTEGELVEILASAGTKVRPGDLIAKLANPHLEFELHGLVGEREKTLRQLENWELNLSRELDLSQLIVEAREKIRQLNEQIEIRQHMLSNLSVKSPVQGTVIDPPNIQQKLVPDSILGGWFGFPLDPTNLGCWLTKEQLICYVGDPQQVEVRILVDQSDISLLAGGQRGQLKPHAFLDRRLNVQLDSVSRNEVLAIPRELSATFGGPLPVKPDSLGRERPLIKMFEARGVLNQKSNSSTLAIGMYGKAKIYAGSATIGWRIWRYAQTIFNFR